MRSRQQFFLSSTSSAGDRTDVRCALRRRTGSESTSAKVPTWALLAGAFLPDFVWVALGLAGVEPSQGPAFFDDWSHSLAMVVVWATLFALCFWRSGMAVMLPVWLSVLSHFALDLPIHPKNLALFPHSSVHLGWNSWNYGLSRSWLGATHYWWIELAFLIVLNVVYMQGGCVRN